MQVSKKRRLMNGLSCMTHGIFNAVRNISIHVARREFFFVFFFVSRGTHQKFPFCVVMISRTERQKIVVQ
jgi:hypothetical protein